MKIIIKKTHNNYWQYNTYSVLDYTQEEYDYMYKYLDFDKLNKKRCIYFKNENTKKWFYKTYTDINYLEHIYKYSPEGYRWLKENYGKGVFRLFVWYIDKEELKTVVNKVINIELIAGGL